MDIASILSLQGRSRRNAKASLRRVRRERATSDEAAEAAAEAKRDWGPRGQRHTPGKAPWMAVNYERDGATGAAVVTCHGCGTIASLGVEQADDLRMETFISEHGRCVATAVQHGSSGDLSGA